MAAEGENFAERLLGWFARYGRHDLPWQIDKTPYRVWVSEIMLQQTQVATVVPYFERFVETLPDVRALAAARIDDVLKLWSGLGYYARARNLHCAAQRIVDLHEGELPRSAEALESLPGVGRSTAAAILALSFGERHAILDGNVKRVLARYHRVHGWAGKAQVAKRLWELADLHTPSDGVAAYTQAIMDLGATICTRAKPACALCPVQVDCAAFATGSIDQLPTPKPRKLRPQKRARILVVRNDAGDFLLERRPPIGIWGGLLAFPELGEEDTVAAWCRVRFGCDPETITQLAPVAHAFTHFELTMEPAYVEVRHAPAQILDHDRLLWYNAAATVPGGLPAPISKLITQLTTNVERTVN
jgi:A/G-specific adenine glycosylase